MYSWWTALYEFIFIRHCPIIRVDHYSQGLLLCSARNRADCHHLRITLTSKRELVMGVGTVSTEFNTACGSIATVICPHSARRSRYLLVCKWRPLPCDRAGTSWCDNTQRSPYRVILTQDTRVDKDDGRQPVIETKGQGPIAGPLHWNRRS